MPIEKENCGKTICQSCGKEFPCGVNEGSCWCFEVELKPETLAELRENFKSCLCRNCLKLANLQIAPDYDNCDSSV